MEDGKNQHYPYSFKTVAVAGQGLASYLGFEIENPTDLLTVEAMCAHIIVQRTDSSFSPGTYPGSSIIAIQVQDDMYNPSFVRRLNISKSPDGNGVIDFKVDLTPLINKTGRNVVQPIFDNAFYGTTNLFKLDMLYTVVGNR